MAVCDNGISIHVHNPIVQMQSVERQRFVNTHSHNTHSHKVHEAHTSAVCAPVQYGGEPVPVRRSVQVKEVRDEVVIVAVQSRVAALGRYPHQRFLCKGHPPTGINIEITRYRVHKQT